MARPRTSRRVVPDDTVPVTGKRLAELQAMLGISATDLAWLLGVNESAIARATTAPKDVLKADGTPRLDPAGRPLQPQPDLRDQPFEEDLASVLLMRFLERFQHCALTPPQVDIAAVVERLNAICGEDINGKILSVAMGREASASGRWLKGGNAIPASVQHAMLVLDRATADPEIGIYTWLEWCKIVEEEAASRGIEDIWGPGGWQG